MNHFSRQESSEIEVQDKVADYYVSERYRGNSLQYHTALIRELMNGAYDRILDVGCGTGIIHDTFPSLDITGVDPSEGMLRHHHGKHILGSVENLPFNDSSFDFVVCRSVLHHLRDARIGLQEIWRVLRPGGTLVCWETNKGTIAHLVRKLTQHGDHFSEYHAQTGGIPTLVAERFKVSNVKFGGFFAYLLCGFPDILKFPDFITSNWRALKRFDEAIPQWILKHIGFYTFITARK